MTHASIQKSTTVRAQRRIRLARTGFAALERVAPAAGARWAERLWFAVPPGGPRRPVEDGAPFEVRSRGRIVRGWTWGSGPAVYLVHGWGGQAGQLASFARPLAAAGFTVVAHDALGHGTSDPGQAGAGSSDIIEFAQCLDAVAAEHGPAHAVVGHSMGALATALAMRHGWLGARRLVMIAPMVNVIDVLPVFAGRLGIGPRVQRRLTGRVEARVGRPLADFDLAALAPDLDWPRLLAVHDRDDRETPFRSTQTLVDAWPGARLVATSGLGHRRILRDPEVVRTVTNAVVEDAAQQLARPA